MVNCCGLFVVGNETASAVPLKECKVSAVVRDVVAQVTLRQTFVNNESIAIEAIYMFPIHPAAAVNNFEVELENGRKFVGVIKNKDQAKADYQKALKTGHGAFLLHSDECSDEIFQSSIGNLGPGEKLTVTIGYITVLANDFEPDTARFVVPTTIAPRYHPDSTSTSAEDNAEAADLQYAVAVPYTVSIELHFEMTKAIKSVTSPSHDIENKLSKDAKVADVSFVSNAEQLDRDIVIVLHGEDLDNPVLVVENSNEETHNDSVCAMVSFVPRFNSDMQKSEIIFLIDTSGSMEGFKMNQAQSALNLLLRSLPRDSYFNVFSFSDRFRSKFEESVRYSQESLLDAIGFVDKLRAYGGTMLLPPLRKIYSTNIPEQFKRQVIILTDGEVSNVREVVSLVRSHSKNARVFTIGIGNSVSHELVEGVAKAGNGTVVYIMENESFSKKVIQQLERAVQPAFAKLNVDWQSSLESGANTVPECSSSSSTTNSFFSKQLKEAEKSQVDIATILKKAPCNSPPIFKGNRYTAFAIGTSKFFNGNKAVLTGSDERGRPFRIEIERSATCTGSILHTAAARILIEEITDKNCYLFEAGSTDESEYQSAVEFLSLQYNLLSSRTAFICIDERELPAWRRLTLSERRTVPLLRDRHGGDTPHVSITSLSEQLGHMEFNGGYDDVDSACSLPMARRQLAPPAMRNTLMMSDATDAYDEADCDTVDSIDHFDDDVTDSASPKKSVIVSEASNANIDKLRRLLSWQLFDGSFTLCDDMCQFVIARQKQPVMDKSNTYLQNDALVGNSWCALDEERREIVLATLVAIGYLVTTLQQRKVEWNMIVDKAVSLLNTHLKQQSRAQYENLSRKLIANLK